MNRSLLGADSGLSPSLEPSIVLPKDEKLSGCSRLFDGQWVWQEYCARFGSPSEMPQRLSVQQLQYQPGRRALVSYIVEWPEDRWTPDDRFAVELISGKPDRFLRYPDDPSLPGLPRAASPLTAAELLAEYVPIPVQRLRVDVVRYRPFSRAVLKHQVRAGWRQPHVYVTLFARVMPPAQLPRLLAAAEIVASAGFLLPRLVGQWPEGGLVWLTEVPGETVRSLVRHGNAPDPHLILDHMHKLWSKEMPPDAAGFDMAARFRSTRRLLEHLLEHRETMTVLQQVEEELEPFTTAWAPSAMAHNDFYDDQMLQTPEGRLALVDFEEAGPGDPLLDVGVFLAHLRRSATLGNRREECEVYRARFRLAALEQFGWEPRQLDLREAYSLFRLSTLPLLRISSDWLKETETGLALAAQALRKP